MFRYVLRRILLMIPTIGLVLFFAFVLQSLSRDDEVSRLIELEGNQIYSSYGAYTDAYRLKAEQLGLLQPNFYFSIRPSYVPKEIEQWIPIRRKRGIIHLLKETRDQKGVLEMKRNLSQLLITLSPNPQERTLMSAIKELDDANNLDLLKLRARKIEDSYVESSSTSRQVNVVLDQIDALEVKKGWILPRIDFNGRKNRLHFWLSRGISSEPNLSLVDGSPAMDKVISALKWTFALSFSTLVIIAIFSILLAYYQVKHDGQWLDRLISLKLYALYAMPLFWIATMMVVFFTTDEYGSWTNIFPSVGVELMIGQEYSFWDQLALNAKRLLLPILCMSVHSLAYITKQTKMEMIESSQKPFVQAARARGLNPGQLLRRHIMPDAMVVYVTLLSGRIASLFTGSLIIEYIFNIPGVGKLMLDSMEASDWPVVFVILIFVSVATMIGYLIGDILLAKLYPRTRKELFVT